MAQVGDDEKFATAGVGESTEGEEGSDEHQAGGEANIHLNTLCVSGLPEIKDDELVVMTKTEYEQTRLLMALLHPIHCKFDFASFRANHRYDTVNGLKIYATANMSSLRGYFKSYGLECISEFANNKQLMGSVDSDMTAIVQQESVDEGKRWIRHCLKALHERVVAKYDDIIEATKEYEDCCLNDDYLDGLPNTDPASKIHDDCKNDSQQDYGKYVVNKHGKKWRRSQKNKGKGKDKGKGKGKGNGKGK